MRKLRIISLAAVLVAGLSQAATAACYADYKAKKDSPLQLHYGVVQLPANACNRRAAAAQIAARIEADDWQLLTVLSVFDETGLAERSASAGDFYLRY